MSPGQASIAPLTYVNGDGFGAFTAGFLLRDNSANAERHRIILPARGSSPDARVRAALKPLA